MPTPLPPDASELDKKIVQRLKAAKIQHRVIEMLETSFNAVIADEGLVLTHAEKTRLLTQAARTILQDMLKKLAARKSARK